MQRREPAMKSRKKSGSLPSGNKLKEHLDVEEVQAQERNPQACVHWYDTCRTRLLKGKGDDTSYVGWPDN